MAMRDLSTSTIDKWMSKTGVVDAAYKTRYLLDTLRETGKKQAKRGVPQQKSAFRLLDGGKAIYDTPLLNKSSGPQNITGDEVLTGRGHNPLEGATWNWVFKGDLVQFNEVDDLRNSGDSRFIDEWQVRITEKMDAMFDAVRYDIATRDTGDDATTGFNGLPYLLDVSGTSDTKSVAGITRSSSIPGWLNNTEASCGAFGTYFYKITTERAVSEANTGKAWNLITTTPTVWASMLTYLQGKGQVQFQNDKDPDPGYANFTWLGAKIVMDPDITSGYLYGMSTEDMFFAVHKNANFKMTEEYEASNQFLKARKLRVMGNLGFRRFWGAASTSGWS